jgi:hypothetical protein
MTRPIARDVMYRRRAFDSEVIDLCVRWYITYRLSYRDLVEMMAERGIRVAHTTILRWVLRYVPEYAARRSTSCCVVTVALRPRRLSFARRSCQWLHACLERSRSMATFRAGARSG